MAEQVSVSWFVDCLEVIAKEEGKSSNDTEGAVRTGIQVGLAIGEARPQLAAAILREIDQRAPDRAISPTITAMVDQLVSMVELEPRETPEP